MKLTTKQVKEVGCAICGAQPHEPCKRANGKSRTSPHLDRRLAAHQFAEKESTKAPTENRITLDELKELTAELAALSRKQSLALHAAPFPKMLAEEKAQYEKRRLRIGKLCELVKNYKPT